MRTDTSEFRALLLQRLSQTAFANALMEPSATVQLHSSSDAGETIARITFRRGLRADLTLEGGAEPAFNFIDGQSIYVENGAQVGLPSADSKAEERRAEIVGQSIWKVSDHWALEAGLAI
jgi:outer membrane usher protein FimD/PapC